MADSNTATIVAERRRRLAEVEARAAAVMPKPRHRGGRVGKRAEEFRDLLWEIYRRSLPSGAKPPDADGGRAYRPDGIPVGCKEAAQVLAVLAEPGPNGEPPALLVLTGTQLAHDICEAMELWRELHGWGGRREGAGRPRKEDG